MHAVSYRQARGPAYHDLVHYTMDVSFLQLRRKLRPRTALEPGTSEQVAQRFHNVWDLNKYSGLLASDCMTAAWDYLSDMGEKALGAQAGHRRSSAPEVMTATEGHKASRHNESVVLRQLRLLLRRLQHWRSGCMSEYDQIHLRRHIRHNLTRLSGQWQELSSITWRGGENTQELCDTIQQLVEKREAEEKDSRINQWKAKMEHGGKACTTYKVTPS